MPNIEFFVSVDGSTPSRIDVNQMAGFITMISQLQNGVHNNQPRVDDQGHHPADEGAGIVHRGFATKPPMGQRTIDYAHKAGESFDGRPFSLAALRDRMIDIGWKSRANTKRLQSNVIRSTIKDKEEFIFNTATNEWRHDPFYVQKTI